MGDINILTRGLAKAERILFNIYYQKGFSSGIHILCFHDVGGEDTIYNISCEELFGIIKSIEDDVISIEDASKIVSRRSRGILDDKKSKQRYVLTFDDGYSGPLYEIYPYLIKRGIPFTCYVTTGYLGAKGYFTGEQLNNIAKQPECTIGSHMCTHPHARRISLVKVQQEWRESRRILEDITGEPIRHAALPYGDLISCSFTSMVLALASGYQTVASTLAYPAKSRMLPRYVYQSNVRERIGNLIEIRKEPESKS